MKSTNFWDLMDIVRQKSADVSEVLLPPHSMPKSKPRKKPETSGSTCHLLLAGFFLGLLFDTEDGENAILRNDG
jgi:hypothetical protein